MPRILAITPHPDDESYSAAATLSAASRSGWRCQVVCASDGERGKRHDSGPAGPEELRSARRTELTVSCATLGIEEPAFLGFPDGGLEDGPALREALAAAVVEHEPDAIITLGADGAYGHPDHIALNGAATAVWSDLQEQPVLLYCSFVPGIFAPQWHACRSMMGEPPSPEVSELGDREAHYELRAGSLEAVKLSAIGAHRTQLPTGAPEGLFPEGVVKQLLAVERFVDARGRADEAVRGWFEVWQRAAE